MIVILLSEGYRYFQSPALPCMRGDMGAGELASARDKWGRFGWTLVAAPNFSETGLSDGKLGLRRGACQVLVADWQPRRVEVWSGREFRTRYRPQIPAHGDAGMGAWGRTGHAWIGTSMMVRSSWPLGSAGRGASCSVLAAHSRSGIARIERCEGSGRESHDMLGI